MSQQFTFYLPLGLTKDQPLVEHLSIEKSIKMLEQAMNNRNILLSISLAEQIVSHAPDSLKTFHQLFFLLVQQQNFIALKQQAKIAISHHKNDALSYQNLANAYRFLRSPQKAMKAQEQAVLLAPKNIQWRTDLGIMHKENGRFKEALACFNACIEQQADFMPAYWYRADITAKLSAEEVSYLCSWLKQSNGLTDNLVNKLADNIAISYCAYTLFKHFDTIGEYTLAFDYLLLGAKYKRATFNYNHQKEIDEHHAIATVFNDQFFNRHSQPANPTIQQKPKNNIRSDSPIFICGLPRSGTTLVEQIISSHSQVVAGDELFELAQATQQNLQKIKPQTAFPFWANELTTEQWLAIGNSYLDLTKHINQQQFFTDKMPLNYKAIGLINNALPQAKIVYCLRPPMDLLLGGFKQIMGQANVYTYDLDELTAMIIAQHQLMQHWLKHLGDKIFVIDYKTLIHQQEPTTKALLNFLNLPWQDQCLDFHNNKRTIHTVSNAQVRKPLFASSIDSWKKYQQQLQPYADKMQQAGLDIF